MDSSLPQVTIKNILPEPYGKEATTTSAAETTIPAKGFDLGPTVEIDLTDLAEEKIDGQLMQYGKWQEKGNEDHHR